MVAEKNSCQTSQEYLFQVHYTIINEKIVGWANQKVIGNYKKVKTFAHLTTLFSSKQCFLCI